MINVQVNALLSRLELDDALRDRLSEGIHLRGVHRIIRLAFAAGGIDAADLAERYLGECAFDAASSALASSTPLPLFLAAAINSQAVSR